MFLFISIPTLKYLSTNMEVNSRANSKKRGGSAITEPGWMDPNEMKRVKESSSIVQKLISFVKGESPLALFNPMSLITTSDAEESFTNSSKGEIEIEETVEENPFADGDKELLDIWNRGKAPSLFDAFMLLSSNSQIYKDILSDYGSIYDLPVNLTTLGKGANGYTIKAVLPINGKNVRAVMKGSSRRGADNLYWEWQAGLALNHLAQTSPIFLTTYGLYKMDNQDRLLDQYNQHLDNFHTFFSQYPLSTGEDPIVVSCLFPKEITLMTQYVDTYKDMDDFLHSTAHPSISILHLESRIIEIVAILHMLYASLALYKEMFTHYDLHPGNVLLSSIPANKYVTIEYRYKGNVYKTNTRLIPVIIDYGRAFYNIKTFNPKNLIDQACDKKNKDYCPETCGDLVGFVSAANAGSGFDEGSYFMDQSQPNPSHDLLLLKRSLLILENSLKKTPMECARFLDGIITERRLRYDSENGTPPTISSKSRAIFDVEDAFLTMNRIVNSVDYQKRNTDLFSKFTKMGTVSIDLDKKFSPFKWMY